MTIDPNHCSLSQVDQAESELKVKVLLKKSTPRGKKAAARSEDESDSDA